MKRLLYVDCCIRGQTSRTRRLAEAFLDALPQGWAVEPLELAAEGLQYFSGPFFQQRQDLLAAGNRTHPRFRYAWQFAQAVLQEGHELACVFFYREGVLNANQLTAPASDEFDLVRGWQSLHNEHGVALHICVAAALRRGVTDEREAQQLALPGHNLQPGFTLSGLGALAEAALTCDRMVQF